MTKLVALVTGASQGIGEATARLFAQNGWTVYAAARSSQDLERLAANVPAIVPLPMDVSKEKETAQGVSDVLRKEGRIDLLVNNAGYGLIGALSDLTMEEIRQQFETNLFGALGLAKAVLPGMMAQRNGAIVNVSSVAGRISVPLMGAYCSSKFALEAWSDALRGEVRPYGIRVIVIEPGPVRTRFGAAAVHRSQRVLELADSPFRTIYQDVQRRYAKGWAGAATSEQVARVIWKAVRSRNPRPRYLIRFRERAVLVAASLVGRRTIDEVGLRRWGGKGKILTE